jgi:hypothetical protein
MKYTWKQTIDKLRILMHDAMHDRNWDQVRYYGSQIRKILDDPDAFYKEYTIC